MPLKQHASIGHWQAQVAVTHPLSSFAGSTPARRTDNMARSSNGRMRDPHSRDMGSIPIRVTDIAKWRNRYTRDVQNVVSASDMRVRLSPWLLTLQVRQVPNGLSYGLSARLDTGICNLMRVGQCSSEPHKL